MPTQPTPAAATLRGIEARYGDRIVLHDVDLVLPRGRTVAVIGPNGSGKSTLLAVLAGLLAPSAGTVDVDRSSIALVLQSTEVDRSLPISVRETVLMARFPHRGMFGRMRAADRQAVDEAMARTAVADLARRQLHQLSGGQRQRVFVAQGLAQQADMLLLDEPITGLDVVSRDVLLGVIAEERAAGRTVVMTTHSLEEAARCDVVVLVAGGRVVAAGPPTEVLAPEHLDAAFDSPVLRLPGGRLVMDDPHHHHHHLAG